MNDMMANAPFCHQSYFSGEKFSCFATKFLKFRFFCDSKKVFLFPSSILAAGLLSGIQLPRIIGSGRDLLSYSLCHTESECRSMLQNTKLNITELSHELCTSLFSFSLVIIRSTKNNTIGFDDWWPLLKDVSKYTL